MLVWISAHANVSAEPLLRHTCCVIFCAVFAERIIEYVFSFDDFSLMNLNVLHNLRSYSSSISPAIYFFNKTGLQRMDKMFSRTVHSSSFNFCNVDNCCCNWWWKFVSFWKFSSALYVNKINCRIFRNVKCSDWSLSFSRVGNKIFEHSSFEHHDHVRWRNTRTKLRIKSCWSRVSVW